MINLISFMNPANPLHPASPASPLNPNSILWDNHTNVEIHPLLALGICIVAAIPLVMLIVDAIRSR